MGTRTGRDNVRQTMDAIAQSYLDFWMIHGINHNAALPHTNLQYDNTASNGEFRTFYILF